MNGTATELPALRELTLAEQVEVSGGIAGAGVFAAIACYKVAVTAGTAVAGFLTGAAARYLVQP